MPLYTDPENKLGLSFDRTEFARYWRDTPFSPPKDPAARERLEPGTCVKTSDGKLCGRVHSNPKMGEQCVVIGHGWDDSDDERWVWKGNRYDFNSTWSID